MPAPSPRRVLPRSRRFPGLGRTAAKEIDPVAVYGVTAAHYHEDELDELMMGLMDPQTNTWAIKPTPARLIEVVDRLLGGDQVQVVSLASDGSLIPGAQLRVKMLESGAETLETVGAGAGPTLRDLPRF